MDLISAHILDCQGNTTHYLVLELDGTVTIRFGAHGREVRVDPRTRTVLTPGAVVGETLMNEAALLRP